METWTHRGTSESLLRGSQFGRIPRSGTPAGTAADRRAERAHMSCLRVSEKVLKTPAEPDLGMPLGQACTRCLRSAGALNTRPLHADEAASRVPRT